MDKLSIEDLWKLEDYAEQRPEFRKRAIARKQDRKLHIGPNLTLLFEDRLLVQYQVQEMLRIERLFERAAIQDELDAYNPLIPDGHNWKATCLIEFEDVGERRQALKDLRGIERGIWARIGEGERLPAIADEDLDRSTEDKTSAVHFLRIEVPSGDAARLRNGDALRLGVDHPKYRHEVEASAATRKSLLEDLSEN